MMRGQQVAFIPQKREVNGWIRHNVKAIYMI